MASIRKRNWRSRGETKTACVVDHFDQHGKRHLRTFPTKKAADAFRDEMAPQVLLGTYTADSTSITVAEACDNWIERCEAEGLERSSIQRNLGHVDHHIKPRIGREKLSKLTTPMVEDFKTELEREKGKALAHAVLVSLKGAIKTAQRQGRVAQNVAQPVTVRRAKRGGERPEVGIDVPSMDEVRAIVEHADGRWRPLLVTAVFCGLRSSELRGLRWSNVDFEAKVIRVRERADRWNSFGPPKSAAGRRDVPMGPMVQNTLKGWKLRCPPGDLNLVFPNGVGRPESQTNIVKRGFVPTQIAAGVTTPAGRSKYSMHSLRHFCASWLIGQGFQPKRIQTILGHSSIQMTFDVYGHWLEQEDEGERLAAAEQFVLRSAANAT